MVGAGGFLYHLLSAGALSGKTVVAADANRRLIEFHQTVQEAPAELVAELRDFEYAGGSDAYHALRDEYNRGAGPGRARRAAVFYVLMHSSFNGMYRENSKGEFNVPIGRPCGEVKFRLTPAAEAAFMDASRATAGVTFVAQDYLETIAAAAAAAAAAATGVFIYADPPYEDTFRGYSAAGYSAAALFGALAASRAACAISNSPAARGLAREKMPACEITDLAIKYSVGAAAESRGAKSELLIRAAARPDPVTEDDLAMLMAVLGLDADADTE